jgi:hypothetical protein
LKGSGVASDNFNRPRRDLEIEVGYGVEVDLRSLVSASQKFSGLIEEVAKDYTGVSRSVRWIVDVQPGSVRLPLKGIPEAENVSAAVPHEVGHVVAKGLMDLEAAAVRPSHFTDRALTLAKDLANSSTDKMPIAVWNGSAGGRVTKQLSANAETILGTPEVSFGTIEGRLEALSIHGTKDFSVWTLGGSAVKCVFGSRLDLEADVLPAVGKRVAVSGRLKTRPNGERVSLDVEELRVIGGRPVSADEVKGILKGYEVADW